MNQLDRTMVALDNMDKTGCFDFLESCHDAPWVKIGLEQYLNYGADFVRDVHKKYDKKIFLDLKLHDIPNTVARAIQSVAKLPVEFLTVHLSGGQAMLEAAQKIRNDHASHINILGVSFLTSLSPDDLSQMWAIEQSEQQQKLAFSRLFDLACKTKTQGIVCSAAEVAIAKQSEQSLQQKLFKVTPGIRFSDELNQASDQKRVLTPDQAFENGSDYIVMGRSLTKAHNLQERLNQLKGSMLS